jgi:hypothetical protein
LPSAPSERLSPSSPQSMASNRFRASEFLLRLFAETVFESELGILHSVDLTPRGQFPARTERCHGGSARSPTRQNVSQVFLPKASTPDRADTALACAALK